MNNIGREKIRKYIKLYDDMPLKQIVQNYNQIELDILEELKVTVDSILTDNGYKSYNDKIYSKGKNHYKCILGFLEGSRELKVVIQNLELESKIKNSEKAIEGFGAIRKIIVIIPSSLSIEPPLILDALYAQIRAAYIVLEKAFINNIGYLTKSTFNKLYSDLETQLEFKNKSDLFGRCWFFISDKEIGFYYFSEQIIRKVIEHYKTNQHHIFSPLELTIWIMSASFPFQKSLGIETWKQKKMLSLPLHKSKYIDEAYNIHFAELLLYKSHDYTGYTICEKRGFFLGVGFPKDIKKDLEQEIYEIKDLLEIHFLNGIKKWSPYITTVKNILKSPKGSAISDFVSSTIAKTTAEILKS